MQHIFEICPNPALKGTLIWQPMMVDDDLAAAEIQQQQFQDCRVQHYWHPEMTLGVLAAETLGLAKTPVAWDMYLLYYAGFQWHGKKFPSPDFWMHQLPEDENLRLDPEILQQQVLIALNSLTNLR